MFKDDQHAPKMFSGTILPLLALDCKMIKLSERND